MTIQSKNILSILLIAFLSTAYGPCDDDEQLGTGEGEDYTATCSTYPSGDDITLLAGIDIFEIHLNYSIPCEVGPICLGATFTTTTNSNLFLGSSQTLDETSVAPSLGVTRNLTFDTSTWEGTDQVVLEIKSSQTGETVLDRRDFTLTVIDPRPENPQLLSPTHIKGQPSCNQVLIVEWTTPSALRGVGGYSYVIVSQDDPYYDTNRWPDSSIDINASALSFTTGNLESGHVWEFNIRTIDTGGLPAKLYSSFWIEISLCEVNINNPRSGDTFQVGGWINVFWDPVIFGGDDISGGYNVDTVDLLKGLDVIATLASNLTNINSAGSIVPDVSSGSDYTIRVVLKRNSVGDMFPDLPVILMGISDVFSITPDVG